MNDTPEFERESKAKLHWCIENFPSPHPFFKPAMAALERKEAEEENSRRTGQPAVHIHDSNVGNLNLGSQVGTIATLTPHTTTEFNEQLRQIVRIANLEWSLLNKPTAHVTVQMVCREVDALRAALVLLYGKCPDTVDSQPLREAIENLDETRTHRFGNLIGSQTEMDRVCELMETALRAAASMVPDALIRADSCGLDLK